MKSRANDGSLTLEEREIMKNDSASNNKHAQQVCNAIKKN